MQTIKRFFIPALVLLLILAVFRGLGDPKPDARQHLIAQAIYDLHTAPLPGSVCTAYDADGQPVADFMEVTAPMAAQEDRQALEAYCSQTIQKLVTVQYVDGIDSRGQPMKTAYMTCIEQFITPQQQRGWISYSSEGTALYDAETGSFSKTEILGLTDSSYALPDGWKVGGMMSNHNGYINKASGEGVFSLALRLNIQKYTQTFVQFESSVGFTMAP